MKRKFIVLCFMLSFLAFVTGELQAQTDAYFSNSREIRSPEVGAGMNFEGFSGQFGHGFNFGSFDTQQNGLGFEGFTGSDAPLADGLFVMAASSLIYLMNKRRKENKK